MNTAGLRAWVARIGMVLVLLNLLAPTVSQALRLARLATPPETRGVVDWCSAGHADAAAQADAALRTSLDACGYCGTALPGHALPPSPAAAPLSALGAPARPAARHERVLPPAPPRSALARAPPAA